MMATSGQVLEMLCPAGGWIISGDDFDNVVWVDDRPRCTKEQFENGFAQYDIWKSEQEAKKAADKTALLNRLGITEEEIGLLLG
jgi:hypothetical protein